MRRALAVLLIAACQRDALPPGLLDVGLADLAFSYRDFAVEVDALPDLGPICRHDGGACYTPDGDVPACLSPDDCGGLPCCYRFTLGRAPTFECAKSPLDCQAYLSTDTGGQTRLCRDDSDCSAGPIDAGIFTSCRWGLTGARCFYSCWTPDCR